MTLLGSEVVASSRVAGGDICAASRVALADGRVVFVKTRDGAPPGFFAAEAAGLTWLGEAGGVPVPEVLAVSESELVLSWIAPGTPSESAAEAFGVALAATHRAGAETFGGTSPGWIGSLPLANDPGTDWPGWYAAHRLLPYLDRAALAPADRSAVESVVESVGALAGPPEPPSRLHGDLWSGNVLWSAAGPAYVVDPAAHGGHRETDLAMLALFGVAHLDRIVPAYDEAYPLADGWRERVALHQLFPLLVHAALFGGGYRAHVGAAARAALARGDGVSHVP
ncbi:MAG TPA: fructosamine kinase family protein [Frankiaceae bacterium]|nr:fructosamine kinase family protein [Frankiaceae bacterium]